MWSGSGSWTSRPSIDSSAFSSATCREQLVLGRLRGEPDVLRVDPDLGRGLVLEPDVDVGRGIVPDEDRREPDLPQLPNLVGDLAADALGERLAVHQSGRHLELGQFHAADVEAERLGELDPFLEVFVKPLHVALVHEAPDHRARLGPPHGVLDEDREQPVRRVH